MKHTIYIYAHPSDYDEKGWTIMTSDYETELGFPLGTHVIEFPDNIEEKVIPEMLKLMEKQKDKINADAAKKLDKLKDMESKLLRIGHFTETPTPMKDADEEDDIPF